ncbi:MAG: peptidoglycan editing factor PgeF [Candidatus Thiodiazotropha sp. (ex Dulcina madagascariensis)]|nr:peptidoglycan editing factor PgeF [Candidatus Thiodiazotropha sp. (ex Dulcina madagascariensis)]
MGIPAVASHLLVMIQVQQSRTKLLFFESFMKDDAILHFITTRQGGVSKLPYESLNLGYHNSDSVNHVMQNRDILTTDMNISISNLTLGQQVHSGNVHVVDLSDKGKGSMSYETGIKNTDGMVTDVPNICLMVLVADCAPVLFYDPTKKVIGIAHSGRMGVVNYVSKNVLTTMHDVYGCKASQIRVGIAPTICGDHYPITDKSRSELVKIIPPNSRAISELNDQPHFSLTEAIEEQLLLDGVTKEHIEISNLCTFENKDLFYSERRDGRPTGRFAAAIMLR